MIQPDGHPGARIMVVNEFPTKEEMLRGRAMSGSGGYEFDKMLHEAGIVRSECWMTYVARVCPPGYTSDGFFPKLKRDIRHDFHVFHNKKHVSPVVMDGITLLEKEIELIKPDIIICLGNVSLWALTGEWGIKTWRGSLSHFKGIPVLPTWTPQYVLRDWQARATGVQDLQRVVKIRSEGVAVEPDWKFILQPTFEQVVNCLGELIRRCNDKATRLSVDVETSAGHITCHGIAWSETEAICIPIIKRGFGEGLSWTVDYWGVEQEGKIVFLLWKLLTHRNVQVVGQNFCYDMQYYWQTLHFQPRVVDDTLILQHTMFPGMEKGLGFLSSIHTDTHVYWKDEGKYWNPKINELTYWRYNAKDACRTFEICKSQEKELAATDQVETYEFQMRHLWHTVLRTVCRGVTVDFEFRKRLQRDLFTRIEASQQKIEQFIGGSLNIGSPVQMAALFYGDFNLEEIRDRKTKAVTCNDEALGKIAKKEPLLAPLVNLIQGQRSLSVLHANCALAQVDPDGKMRTNYNVGGTETMRLASSKTPFRRGMNMQNVTKGQEANHAKGLIELPNIRKMFIPSPGHLICDSDLDRADLQVVVWEADDEGLKKALREGMDLHLYNARDIFRLSYPDDEIMEGTEICEEHKARYKKERQGAKMGCHAVNYGASARTIAAALGISVREAEQFISSWFSAHPGILEWHRRTESLLRTKHTVYNRFGYRRPYFDRVDGLLPEALAWVPQSTVACVINRIWVLIDETEPLIKPLIQVHDSLVTEFLVADCSYALRRMSEIAKSIIIPYDDPLNIPLGAKVARTSWGDCGTKEQDAYTKKLLLSQGGL